MKKEYTIKDLLVLLLGKVWYIIGASLICAFLALFVSKFVMSEKYESHISMYVKSADAQQSGQDKTNVDLQDINASKSLVQTYIVILTDDPVMNEVSDKLLEMYSPEELSKYFTVTSGRVSKSGLRNAYNMTAVNQTEVLQITATTTNAKLSADLCNIMAEVAPSFLIRVVGAGSVEKIGDAEVYNTPVSPNVTKNTALGFFGGLMLSALVILVIDFFDNTVKDSDDLGETYQKPIVGEIMNIGGKLSKNDNGSSADRKKKLLLNNKEIPFNVVENYKTMRTNLMFTLSTTRNKIVVVSSPNPSEGKSVTVANLAVSMAETENRVLLIDADMRKPVQHRNFRLKNNVGLSTILSGESTFEKCVHENKSGNFALLTSGVIPPNPSELLASEKMRELLELVQQKYDYVIIDGTPLLPVTDVMGLADEVAGVLLVARYGKTTFSEIEESMKKLEIANCNLLGFVLNDISVKKGSHYGYKYNYKYKYDYGYRYGGKETKDTSAEN